LLKTPIDSINGAYWIWRRSTKIDYAYLRGPPALSRYLVPGKSERHPCLTPAPNLAALKISLATPPKQQAAFAEDVIEAPVNALAKTDKSAATGRMVLPK
jgi:hypothetical protein